MAGRWISALMVVSLTALPSAAHAAGQEGPVVVLAWQTPPGSDCATGEEIRERVARLTERRLSLAGSAPSHRIRVSVLEQDAIWRAHVTMFGPDGAALGAREIRGRSPSCHALDVPTALVIATALDALPAQPTLPEPPEDGGDDGAGGGRVGFGAHVLASVGQGPSTWFGFGLELELPLGLPVVIEAGSYLPSEQTDGLGRGARLWEFHAGAGVCPRLLGGGALELRACGTAYGGFTWARGVGLTQSASAVRPLAILGLGPKLLIGVADGLAAELSVLVGWVAVRPRFQWDIEGEPPHALQASPVVLLARIGVIGFAR